MSSNTQITQIPTANKKIDEEEIIKETRHQIQNTHSMKDTIDKINRKMIGLENIFSKPKINRWFKSKFHKELLQPSNQKERQQHKGKRN